jgi:hypothetical protein
MAKESDLGQKIVVMTTAATTQCYGTTIQPEASGASGVGSAPSGCRLSDCPFGASASAPARVSSHLTAQRSDLT